MEVLIIPALILALSAGVVSAFIRFVWRARWWMACAITTAPFALLFLWDVFAQTASVGHGAMPNWPFSGGAFFIVALVSAFTGASIPQRTRKTDTIDS